VELPFAEVPPEGELGVALEVDAEVGQEVVGPEGIFATVLAELTLSGRGAGRGALAADVLREPPRVAPFGVSGGLHG
jgi:hypothetical protein